MTANGNDNDSNRLFKEVFKDVYHDEFDIHITLGDFKVAPKHEKKTQRVIYM